MAMGPLNTGGDGGVEAALEAHLKAKNPHGVNYEDVGADPAGAAGTAQAAAQRYADNAIGTAIGALDTGVSSFNGRRGAVTPQQGDYTPEQVGAAPVSHGTHVTYSDTVPVMDGMASAGVAASVARSDHRHPSDTNKADANHKHTAADVGAVPDTVTVNGKRLSGSVQLSASDVGAASGSHTHVPGNITGLVGTDYWANRVRGISFTSSSTASPSVSNGCIVLTYL